MVSFIIGVTAVPRKGAALVGVQMKPGDKWRCQGEHEAVKVVVGSKIAEGDICLQAFDSLWSQLWILLKRNQIINLKEVPVTLIAESQFTLALPGAKGMRRNQVLLS